MRGFIALLAVVSFPALAATNQLMDVNSLNQLLQEKHAGWVAKDNHLNQMGLKQLKAMLGVKRKSGNGARFYVNRTKPNAALPTVLDWRNNNGNWVTPILDQGYCGSCVAFATIGSLETQYRISTGFAGFNVRLSPQYIFSCGGGSCDGGWQPQESAQFLETTGAPAESCLPYTSGETGADVACSAACTGAKTATVKIKSFTTPTQDAFDINSLKAALQNGPLTTTLDVYADFELYSSGVYKHVTGDWLGGHAVSIIGYDDTQQALIIRNSWGEDWGESGFAYVAYTDISGVGDNTWSYSMPTVTGALSVSSPIDYSYFTGTAPVAANSTYPGTDSITVTFYDKNNSAVYNTVCQSNACTTTADVSGLADGEYTVQAVAMDSTGRQLTTSDKQSFFVANSQPTLSVSFVGDGVNLSQPLKGVILFQISVSSSNGVPLSSILFHYKGVNGVETVRSATAVASGMLLDWGTTNVPNGATQLWMEGHMTTNGFDDVFTTPVQTVTVQN